MVQTAGVVELNDTVRPEVDVATRLIDGTDTLVLFGVVKVIVWGACAITKLFEMAVAA